MTAPNSPDLFTTRVVPANAAGIAEGARLIAAGACVAVPTETVYGLAADATSATAVAGVYEAKGRPSFNPLIVHVSSIDQAETVALFDGRARELAERYWPGPLTLVVPARPGSPVSALATAGLATVAVRAPAHSAMRALIEASGRPLATPSANMSGGISPTTAAHVLKTLSGRISLVIDGGPTRDGLESTIVALTGNRPRLLRAGPIPADELLLSFVENGYGIEAPGQLQSHYRPGKPLTLNVTRETVDAWLIGFGRVGGRSTLSASGNLQRAASRLYALLHEADAGPCANIAVAPVPNIGIGAAINDRLRRAAAPITP